MGTIHYWGLTISVMNTVFLVLAVGLSVDYSSHIGHTFMTTSGKPSGKLPISGPQFSGFLASGWSLGGSQGEDNGISCPTNRGIQIDFCL